MAWSSLLFGGGHHLQAAKHATLNGAQVSPTHILRTGLTSEWYEKTPVLSSQLWTLEASKCPEKASSYLGVRSYDECWGRIRTCRLEFIFSNTTMAVPPVPLWPTLKLADLWMLVECNWLWLHVLHQEWKQGATGTAKLLRNCTQLSGLFSKDSLLHYLWWNTLVYMSLKCLVPCCPQLQNTPVFEPNCSEIFYVLCFVWTVWSISVFPDSNVINTLQRSIITPRVHARRG